jgi:hypothetical protein
MNERRLLLLMVPNLEALLLLLRRRTGQSVLPAMDTQAAAHVTERTQKIGCFKFELKTYAAFLMIIANLISARTIRSFRKTLRHFCTQQFCVDVSDWLSEREMSLAILLFPRTAPST